MEENKNIVDEKSESCVCDLVNSNIDIISQMKAKIAELENMIKNNSHCYCGRLFNKKDELDGKDIKELSIN